MGDDECASFERRFAVDAPDAPGAPEGKVRSTCSRASNKAESLLTEWGVLDTMRTFGAAAVQPCLQWSLAFPALTRWCPTSNTTLHYRYV